jgi:glutamate/aspartate transport system substrate-binding protein
VHLKLPLSILAAVILGAGSTLAQDLTGTLKKIKDSGAITLGHRESSVPFSYYDDKQQLGAMPWICARASSNARNQAQPGDCGDAYPADRERHRGPRMRFDTNNLERQKQVSFTITLFVTANRFVSKKAANLKTVDDLKGKTIVSTSGSTNIKQITEIGAQKGLNLNVLAAKDHAEAFLMVETGRAAAFVMDDILLYSLVAASKSSKDYVISADALSVEPYGIMQRRDDAPFKKVVDQAMIETYRSGAINAIHDKRFLKPIPPKGINLNVPMSAAFKKVIASPTDSGDPAVY